MDILLLNHQVHQKTNLDCWQIYVARGVKFHVVCEIQGYIWRCATSGVTSPIQALLSQSHPGGACAQVELRHSPAARVDSGRAKNNKTCASSYGSAHLGALDDGVMVSKHWTSSQKEPTPCRPMPLLVQLQDDRLNRPPARAVWCGCCSEGNVRTGTVHKPKQLEHLVFGQTQMYVCVRWNNDFVQTNGCRVVFVYADLSCPKRVSRFRKGGCSGNRVQRLIRCYIVVLLHNTTRIHCTPPPTAPPCNEYPVWTACPSAPHRDRVVSAITSTIAITTTTITITITITITTTIINYYHYYY